MPADLIDDSGLAEAIAARFVRARRDVAPLDEYPGTPPATLAKAYAIQDAAIALDGRRIAGWKVGKIAPPVEGVDRLAGPIFADDVVTGDRSVAMPVHAGGFAAAEAEFLLRVGAAPDPAKRDWTVAEAMALIDAVHVGIEIASSPFVGINEHGPAVTISDFGNNNGLVVGATIPDWREAGLADWPVELRIGDVVAGRATAATMLDGPFGAARFLFASLARRGIALEAGQWISSGAVTGVHPVAVGDTVEARFGDGYRIACTIRAQ